MAALSINILNRDEALFQTTINYEIRDYAETIRIFLLMNFQQKVYPQIKSL